jgi:hypothetical protein
VDLERLARAQNELETRGLVVPGVPPNEVTPAGRDVSERLKAARLERLSDLLADWSPAEHRQVGELLRRYSSDLSQDEAPGPATRPVSRA